MAAINKAFVAEDDFVETSQYQDRSDSLPPPPPSSSSLGKVCHVDTEPIDDSRTPKLLQIFAALPAIFGAFSIGTYLGWCSPVQPQFNINGTTPSTALETNKDEQSVWYLKLDEDQMSWTGSLINVGAMVGCLLGGFLMDRFGRKMILLAVFFFFTVGWIFITLAVVPSMLYLGRIIGGIAGGVCCVVGPTYIGEITTVSMRGSLGLLFSVMMSAGILATSCLGWLHWRWISGICGVQPLLVVIGTLFVPDTPYFLIKKGCRREAESCLYWLRGYDYNVKAELSRIEAIVIADEAQEGQLWSNILQPGVYKPLMIGVSLMVLQQVCGINAALFNSVEIFRMSGSNLDGLTSAIILNLVMLVAGIGSTILLERLGRRILFLVSEVLCCVSMLAFGGYFYALEYLPETTRRLGWIPLPLLLFYITVFAIGVGPLPWLVAAEVMPTKFKGPASSIVTCTNWIASFIVTKVFINMQRSLTNAGAFCLFGGLCFTGILFGFFVLPETKGKTPQQIQALFTTDKPGTST